MNGLTPKQAECLTFLKDYIANSGGVGPTFDEMEEGFGVCRSRVHTMLVSLEERGAIRRLVGRARAIEIVWQDNPSKSTKDLTDEICRLVWEWSGRSRPTDDLAPMVMEALS